MSIGAATVTQLLHNPKILVEKLEFGDKNLENEASNEITDTVDSAPKNDENLENSLMESSFNKMPLVSIPRCDRIAEIERILRSSQTSPETLSKAVLEQFPGFKLKDCHVNVIQDDLKRFKCFYNNDNSIDTIMNANLNANKLTCKFCSKEYDNTRKLKKHLDKKHLLVDQSGQQKKRVSFSDKVIVHEVEYHKCRRCNKIFNDYEYLKAHKKERHKKRKMYICDYCKNNFADRAIFKIHIKLHCDVCEGIFQSKSELLQHRRDVCQVKKIHKCRTCFCKFYSIFDLREHNYDHIGTFFVCDICRLQLDTKCYLIQHVLSSHLNVDISNKYENHGSNFICNFCEILFFDEASIKNHFEDNSELILPDIPALLLKPNMVLPTPETVPHIVGPGMHEVEEILPDLPKIVVKEEAIRKPIILDKEIRIVLHKLENTELFKKRLIHINNVFPKRKAPRKTPAITPHQCIHCLKYYSSGHALRRHLETMHYDLDNLTCRVCEETFEWPSLLKSHKCIRVTNDRYMPKYDNSGKGKNVQVQNTLNINTTNDEIDDYFEIPPPLVELTEFEVPTSNATNPNYTKNLQDDFSYGSNVTSSGQTSILNNHLLNYSNSTMESSNSSTIPNQMDSFHYNQGNYRAQNPYWTHDSMSDQIGEQITHRPYLQGNYRSIVNQTPSHVVNVNQTAPQVTMNMPIMTQTMTNRPHINQMTMNHPSMNPTLTNCLNNNQVQNNCMGMPFNRSMLNQTTTNGMPMTMNRPITNPMVTNGMQNNPYPPNLKQYKRKKAQDMPLPAHNVPMPAHNVPMQMPSLPPSVQHIPSQLLNKAMPVISKIVQSQGRPGSEQPSKKYLFIQELPIEF